MVAWGVSDLSKKWQYRKEILFVSFVLSILCLSIITWTQVGYWQNSITLYDHTLKVTDYNCVIYNNRGIAYSALGNYGQAIDDCSRAIEIDPGFAGAYYNRGNAYNGLSNHRQAIEDYSKAIEIRPGYADAYNNRGYSYLLQGNKEIGCRDAQRACELGTCKSLEFAKGKGLCR